MQRLVFEQAWEKTIDPEDKQQIVTVFEQANVPQKSVQKFIPFRQARNHRNDLLVTVIVQNFGDIAFTLEDIELTYYEAGQPVASHTFSHPGLMIAPKCSMPWTFIFPENKVMSEPRFENGYISTSKPI